MNSLLSGLKRLARKLGITFLYMTALAAASAPATLWVSPAVAMAIGLVVWIVGSALAVHWFEDDVDGWAIICAIVPVVMVAFGFHDYVALARGAKVSGISVAQAPQYANSRAFEFVDPLVQRKLSASYRSQTRDRKSGRVSYHYFNVVPLTSNRWTKSDPVPVWLGCSDTLPQACTNWAKGCHSAIAVDENDRSGMQAAIRLALAEHGLTTVPMAPLLQCVASVDAGQDERLKRLWLPLAAIYLLWAFAMLSFQGVQAIRNR